MSDISKLLHRIQGSGLTFTPKSLREQKRKPIAVALALEKSNEP